MILKLLLNTQLIWMKFIKILKNPNKNRKILIVFENLITDIFSDKKLNPIVTELFVKDRKLSLSLVFINNLTLLFQKKLDQTLNTVLSWNENSKLTRISKNCIESLIRYWL